MKKVFSLLVLLISFTALFAQERSVSGRVVDESSEPLPGVNVIVKGTKIGSITDVDGNFKISLPVGKNSLVFTFIGFTSQEVDASKKNNVTIQLKQSAIGLQEVVAVGYGSQKKVNLTGSVATVDGKELAAKPVARASMALQGVAPGVTVTQSSGAPGSDGGTIRIRGIGTLNDSNPLVLIDGSEGSIDGINSNDIENISVLKDAASAAIYGSRAANGVILITTKRAKKGDFRVNYNGYAGWQRFTMLPEYVDGLTYMQMDNQGLINAGKSPIWSQTYMDEYAKNRSMYSYKYPDVNWEKLLYSGSGFEENHNLTISGGTDKLGSTVSLAYMKQDGLALGCQAQRYSVRINNDYKPFKNLQFKFDLSGRYSPIVYPIGGVNSAASTVERLPALMAVYLPDGRYSTNFMGYGNALAGIKEGGNQSTDYYSATGRLSVNYQPLKGLDIELAYLPTFGYSYENDLTKIVNAYNDTSNDPALVSPSKNSMTETYNTNRTHNLHALLNYNKSYKQHNFKLLGGYEQINYKTRWFSAYRENFPFIDYAMMNNGSVINMSNGGDASEWALRSLFGRFNYDFNGKYLFEANVRYDGSSRFAVGHKYGTFPSFSAGWRISEESFMKRIKLVDNLKLRASWGQLGNQNIGTYPFASVMNLGYNYSFNGVPVNGAALTSMANPNISWETTTSTNFGVDFTLLKHFSGTFEYYIRKTDGILEQLPISSTIGMTAPYQNAGKVQNKGWDLSLTYSDQQHPFKYSVSVSLSDVQNKVLDLKGAGPYIGSYTITQVGQPIGALYMWKADGLYRTADELAKAPIQVGTLALGDIRYKDINGDGKVDAKDRVVVGNNIPRYTFGLNFNSQYKGFDLTLFIQGVGKRDTYLDGYNGWAFWNFCNIQKYQTDAWSPTNPNASQPRLIDASSHNNFNPSTFWMHNAAYARLKTVQLGYTLPSKISKFLRLEKTRIYFSGDNVLTLDHLPKGWDPEQPMGNSNTYPIASTFVFGLDLSF